MEYLEKARLLIFNIVTLTPQEMCFLCTEVAKQNFANWHHCEVWIIENARQFLKEDLEQSYE